jgi:methionyl-tRNA formyltransferase
MTARRAAVFGKGALAAHACDILAALPGTILDTVIPVAQEPGWDLSLSDHVTRHHRGTRLVDTGDWRDLEPGRCDLVVSALYDKIIGSSLIDATPRIINVHPGPLPRYRGARPVNWALLNGERSHGITIHEIDPGVDSGPILAQAVFSVWPDLDEVRDVWNRCMAHGRLLLEQTLPVLDQITPVPQDHDASSVHYTRDSHRLGERADWSRALSTAHWSP